MVDTVTAFRRTLATKATTLQTKSPPPAVDSADIDGLFADLGRIEDTLDPTLDLMQAVAAATALEPVRIAATACATRLTALRAELFTDAHLMRAVSPFAAQDPHKVPVAGLARAVHDTLRRSGASLSADQRARLAVLQQDMVRLSDAILAHLTSPDPALVLTPAELDGLPAHLLNRAAPDGLSLRFTDLADVAAFSRSASTREAARAARLAATSPLRPLYVDLLTLRHEAAALLGYDSWAHYIADATQQGRPEALLKRLVSVADLARPFAAAEVAAINLTLSPPESPGTVASPHIVASGDLDHALLTSRQPQAPTLAQTLAPTHLGPWPYRPLPPTTAPPAVDWTATVSRRLAAPSRTWFSKLDADLEAYAPLAVPRRVTHPARALGLLRQVQLATFTLEAHQLAPPITAQALDSLYVATLTRFDLAGLYPNDWPTFHQLATATSYHLIVEGLLRALTPTDAKTGYDLAPHGALTRWLTPEP